VKKDDKFFKVQTHFYKCHNSKKVCQLFDVDFQFETLEYQSALVLWDKVIFSFF
jgi:hypothetical protein